LLFATSDTFCVSAAKRPDFARFLAGQSVCNIVLIFTKSELKFIRIVVFFIFLVGWPFSLKSATAAATINYIRLLLQCVLARASNVIGGF